MKLGRLCFFVVQRGVRGLMLDMYDFRNDIWLCHSFAGICQNFTAFVSSALLFYFLLLPPWPALNNLNSDRPTDPIPPPLAGAGSNRR